MSTLELHRCYPLISWTYTLIEPTTKKSVYKSSFSFTRRKVKVFRSATQDSEDTSIGFIRAHYFSSDMDLWVHDQHAVMQRKHLTSFDSVIDTAGFTGKWRTRRFDILWRMKLIDRSGQVVAEVRFPIPTLRWTKAATLHFRVPVDETMKNWIVVSFLAKVEEVRKMRMGTMSAVGAGAAAC
ncbi:hypothetical protein QQS21_012173 [Conoideocrella luteorostrata]|uniref:Uncharacterized protein n=1 Tax=Conoideocrella luteorostrata TaxID=1105319 RepID=A0AAJ0FSP0_9HYPO|nr:hypothetical protein QQS21_012173 [Conoideocrella luteorostrata]